LEEFKLVSDESIFSDLTPEETTLVFYILGIAFSQSLTIDEINVLANGLFEMAQVLFIIASQRTLINDAIKAQQDKEDAEKAKEEKKSVERLESEIKKLQDYIENMQKQIDELKK
jgi:predicted ribosome quality control (RQC) complex YloA/Tae2 family protein